MTIKELKEELNNYPDDMLVFAYNQDDSEICYPDIQLSKLSDNNIKTLKRMNSYTENKDKEIDEKIGDKILMIY